MPKEILTLSQVKSIFVHPETMEAMKEFIGSMIVDRGLLAEGKLFYSKHDKATTDIFRVLDTKYFHKYKNTELSLFEFKLNGGITNEFFKDKKFSLYLPIVEDGVDMTQEFLQHVLGKLASSQAIDDLWYSVIKDIIKMCGVCYNREQNIFGFSPTRKRNYLLNKGEDGVKTMLEFDYKSYTLEGVLQSEIDQGYVNSSIGDPERNFAYTHLLRANAEFKLFSWARVSMINWSKYNILATSRGQGKTFLAAFTAARELLVDTKGFGGRKKRMIKVFTPEKEDIGKQMMDYLEDIIGSLAEIKLPNGKKAFEISKSNFSVVCNITGHELKVISLHNYAGKAAKENGTSKGEGLACDIAIIDEAARIPDEFWTSFHQRAAFETQRFFIISTINKETPADHWFYKLLVESETGQLKNAFAQRVTIEQNEAMRSGLSDTEWEEALNNVKRTLREGGDRELYAKGYCIILEESNVFDLTGVLIQPPTFSDQDPRIIGFDLGKLDDSAAIIVINLKNKCIESATKYDNTSYGIQLSNVEAIKKKFPNSLVIGDRSGVGEVVAELDTKGIVDSWIKSTGAGELKYNKQNGYWTCSKTGIIGNLQLAFETNLLKVNVENQLLIQQFKDFMKMKSPRGDVVLFKGKGKTKDDLVLASAYANLYMFAILGLKTEKDIDYFCNTFFDSQISSYNNDEIQEEENQYYNNLY